MIPVKHEMLFQHYQKDFYPDVMIMIIDDIFF
jgi:hypothetical protein